MVRAVQDGPLAGQLAAQLLVDRPVVLLREVPSSDSGLVRDKHDGVPGGPETTHGARRTVEEPNRGRIRQVVTVLDEGAVPVEKDGRAEGRFVGAGHRADSGLPAASTKAEITTAAKASS